jgi:hypothetical protein
VRRTWSGEHSADELRLGLGLGLAVVGVLGGGSGLQRCVLVDQGGLDAQAVAEEELLVSAAFAGLHEV